MRLKGGIKMKEENKMNWVERAFEEVSEDVKQFQKMNPDFSNKDIEEAIREERREELLFKIKKLPVNELLRFHESYMEYISQVKKGLGQDSLIVGEDYHFWLNDEDDIYDEKYGKI